MINVLTNYYNYYLSSSDFKLLKCLEINNLVKDSQTLELKNICNFDENRDKIVLYDFLQAKTRLYKDLLDINDIDFYKKNGIYNIYKYLKIIKNIHKKYVCHEIIAKYGNVKWLKLAYNHDFPIDTFACDVAAKYGRINCLKYLKKIGHAIDTKTFKCSIENGHINCIDYINKTINIDRLNNTYTIIAAYNGQLESLKYLCHNNYSVSKITGINAIINGSLDCLKYLIVVGCQLDEEFCSTAAKYGRLEFLKYLRGMIPPCPWDEETTINCAKYGHLNCLKYVGESIPPCPWNEWVCNNAYNYRHEDCLKYATDNGCPFFCDDNKKCLNI